MNKSILLLSPNIASDNKGDDIIMECVRKELGFVLNENFVYDMPTHLPAFSSFSVWRNSLAVQNYSNCDWKFAGGSNLLVKDLKTHYPQWNIHPFNSKPLQGTILVGVGAGAGDYTNKYTTKLYRKVLNHKYYHSVRDERSKEYVESLGLKAINTGCVTMWKLTPTFCREIPTSKADNVVFTLTGRNEPDPLDQKLINILLENYAHVSFWIQGDKDAAYLHMFENIEDIEIIPPSKDAYDKVLSRENIEYIGTRLHGGIYALRHKKRAIIISIDERASSISKDTGLLTIEKTNIDGISSLINSEFNTKLNLPFGEIERWKRQFME